MTTTMIEPRVLFSPDTESLSKHTKRLSFQSVGGDTKGGAVSRIRIDNVINSILCTDESYLNFTAEITASTTGPATSTKYFLSPNAGQNCIKKIEILTNGASILVCDNYNNCASILNIANCGTNSAGLRGITEGGGILETKDAPATTASVLDAPNNGVENYLGGTSVALMYGAPTVLTPNTKALLKPMSFSVPILGLMSSCLKHLPLSYLSASLEIQITWEDEMRKIITSDGTLQRSTCVYSDINFDARLNIYDEASMQVINERNGWRTGGEPVVWTGRQYKASLIDTQIGIQNATSNQDTLVPNSRYRCLDNIIQGAFPNPDGKSTWLPFLGADEYQIRIGSELFPRQKIESLCEVVMNTQACFSGTSQSLSNTQMNSNGTKLNERQAVNGLLTKVKRCSRYRVRDF